ncbi:MAG: ribosomal protein S18-alanine N-acetyltransferase [Chloroflexia bacterium]
MRQEDVVVVAEIERLCFSMPWPTSAYRRELKTPETNRYIVARFVEPSLQLDPAQPPKPLTPDNLTMLTRPELHTNNNGAVSQSPNEGIKSLWTTLLPWLRRNGNGHADALPTHRLPLVGYAGLWLMVDEAHVTTIGVNPAYRGQGVGELLFLGLVDISREMKASRMTLEVRVSNTSAQALYRKYGLEVAGMRKRYYSDNGEDAYIMWSEPLDSPQFEERVTTLREELVARLQQSYNAPQTPTRPIEKGRLQ